MSVTIRGIENVISKLSLFKLALELLPWGLCFHYHRHHHPWR